MSYSYFKKIVIILWKQKFKVLIIFLIAVALMLNIMPFYTKHILHSQITQVNDSEFPGKNQTFRDVFSTWVLPADTTLDNIPTEIKTNTLINLKDFEYILDNPIICMARELFVFIIVHSALQNFEDREIIRSTWGSVKYYLQKNVRLAFFLGDIHNLTLNQFPDQDSKDIFIEKVLKESKKHGDIISGTFEDTYRNLSYKHIMGYKFANYYCGHAEYILKVDDDVFVDPFQLVDILIEHEQRNNGKELTNLMVCGFTPDDHTVQRGHGKWRVTSDEYPFSRYPRYCPGAGYLITHDVITRILQLSQVVTRTFWKDDAFVTGILAEITDLPLVRDLPGFTSAHYSLEYMPWLRSESPGVKNPFVVLLLPRGEHEVMKKYWEKVKKFNKVNYDYSE